MNTKSCIEKYFTLIGKNSLKKGKKQKMQNAF